MSRAARRRQAAALSWLLTASASAWAGPPFVTDDPEPVGLHKWEVNWAAAGSWEGNSYSIGIPAIDINYGPTPNLQIHALPLYTIERSNGEITHGLDDTEIGFKYRFFDRQGPGDTAFMLGIYPMYRVATGAHRLGPDRGTHGVLLPLWAQYEAGPWTAYGGAGYRINHGTDAKNSVFTGITLLRKLNERLQLGGEVFHETAISRNASSTDGFNLGGVRVLTPSMNLLFSAGRSFGDGGSNLFYVGLQTHF